MKIQLEWNRKESLFFITALAKIYEVVRTRLDYFLNTTIFLPYGIFRIRGKIVSVPKTRKIVFGKSVQCLDKCQKFVVKNHRNEKIEAEFCKTSRSCFSYFTSVRKMDVVFSRSRLRLNVLYACKQECVK